MSKEEEKVEKSVNVSNKTENGLVKNDYKDIGVYKNKKIVLSKKAKIVMFSVIGVLLVICIVFGTIICANKMNSNVYKNVYMLGEDFSNMTPDGVMSKVKQMSDNMTTSESLEIYQDGENIYTLKAEDIEFKFDIDKTTQSIITFGRDDKTLKNNMNIINAHFSKKVIDPVYTYNDEKLNGILKNIDLTIKDRYVDDSYSLDEKGGKLIIVNGKKGYTFNYDNEKKGIVEAFKDKDKKTYDINVEEKSPEKLDAQTVYDNVKRDAKDAYVDTSVNPQKYVAEIVGYDFDLNALKQLLSLPENQVEGKTIEFKVNVIEPKIKLANITADLCKDKLSGYTTYFPAGVYARSNNLRIALSYMNGVVVLPGETYSYNNNIGDTTASKGYQAAATFKAGTTVNEMGGGICQTVSTLYNVALMANLEIVERHQHGLPVGYVPPSRDATVYSPVLDFKFKNNRTTPVKIVTSFSYNGSLKVSIYGTKQSDDPEVTLSQKTLSTIPFTTRYDYDASLPYGQQVVTTGGVNGYTSESYITKRLNGQVIYSGVLSKDMYNAQQQVIRVGTSGS